MWKPEKMKAAMRQDIQRPPQLGVPKAEMARFEWKNEAEEQIVKLAPMGWKSHAIAAYPVSLVLNAYPNDGYWMDIANKESFIQECVAKTNELYSEAGQ